MSAGNAIIALRFYSRDRLKPPVRSVRPRRLKSNFPHSVWERPEDGRHQAEARPALSGWFGHKAPFAFDDAYEPAEGISRFLVGTPPILGLAALEVGVDLMLEADMAMLREKSIALSSLFAEAMEPLCAKHGFRLVSPANPAERGSQISYAHPEAYPIVQALIARGVAEERLVLVEYDPDFCNLLRRRFPQATVVQGDAYALADTLAGIVKEPIAAIVSCLPLMTRPLNVRVRLLNAAIRMLRADAPFVQFTYAMTAPIPSRARRYRITSSPRIWKNLPPARVWVYRAD